MLFTKEHTSEIKGLAILSVIIGHFINAGYLNNALFKYAGAWGVCLFLVMSGYGLSKSYSKDKEMNHFFSKRIEKVFLPYFIITVIWLLFFNGRLFFIKDIKTVVLVLIGFDFDRSIDGTMWYISFMFIWYVLFFFIFKLPIKTIIKILLLLCLSYFIRSYDINGFDSINYQFHLHWLSFPLGVILGVYENYFEIFRKKMIFVFLVLICILISCYSYNKILNSINYYSVFSIAMSTLIILLTYITPNKIKMILKNIGEYSYELYLIEGMVIFNIGVFDKTGLLVFPILFMSSMIFKKMMICIKEHE